MRSWTIAFSLGMYSLLSLPRLPEPVYMTSIAIGLVLCGISYYYKPSFIALCVIGFLLGFSWAYLIAQQQLAQRLPAAFMQQSVLLYGTVASIPHRFALGKRFIFVVDGSDVAEHRQIHATVQLAYYKKYVVIKPGQRWQLRVRLKALRSYANPGSFDYTAWLFAQHIHARGYVVASKQNQVLSQRFWQYPVTQFRFYLSQAIANYNPQPSITGLINALLIGDKQAVSTQQWQWFQQTGTSHLLAISGLHIGLVATWCYFIMLFLWRRFASCCLLLPATKAAALASIAGAILYSLLAGLSLPTQRALIMISVLMLAKLNNKSLLNWHAWCLALAAVLIYDPLALLSAGFYLSFMAVACLIYTSAGRLSPGRYWQYWRPQFAVVTGLMPLGLWFFSQSSLLAFVANSVAIPFVSLCIVPLVLIAALSLLFSTALTQLLLWLASGCIKLLLLWLAYLSAFQHFIWHATLANHYVLISSHIALLLLLAPAAWPARYLGLLWLLPLFYFPYPKLKPGEFFVTLLDVGQGLSLVVKTQQHVLLYDAGPKFSDSFDAGRAVILPFLLKQNIHQLDVVVISHGDNDHIGGFYSIQNNFPINTVYSSVPDKFQPQSAVLCHAGQHWQWDGVTFTFLYPEPGFYQLRNNSSCVLKISNGVHSVLLTGDIEKVAEQQLLKTAAKQLAAAILCVPHHGSKTSSSENFIAAIDPDYALFAVGYRNRYGFPKQTIVHRYQQIHAQLLSTAQSGAISFKVTQQPLLRPEQYRLKEKHIWD